jgi:hypothetical protein
LLASKRITRVVLVLVPSAPTVVVVARGKRGGTPPSRAAKLAEALPGVLKLKLAILLPGMTHPGRLVGVLCWRGISHTSCHPGWSTVYLMAPSVCSTGTTCQGWELEKFWRGVSSPVASSKSTAMERYWEVDEALGQ